MPSALDHALNTPQTAIGKGTVGDPSRPAIRLLNRENRRMLNRAEKRQLVEEGWYTDGTNGTVNQFHPVDKHDYAAYLAYEDYRQGEATRQGHSYQRAPYRGRNMAPATSPTMRWSI